MVQLKIVIRKHKAITSITDAQLQLLYNLKDWEQGKALEYPKGVICG